MLAVIGDLHMQHTAEDGIRYRDEAGVVHRMVDERNVHVRALRRFVHYVLNPDDAKLLEPTAPYDDEASEWRDLVDDVEELVTTPDMA